MELSKYECVDVDKPMGPTTAELQAMLSDLTFIHEMMIPTMKRK
jgi:hypothetical protein